VIIHGIRAANVLKYAELAIDLSDRGLIAISGANESGKSSIGETICFALFGRTFSIGPDEIVKIVRWGENDCSVELEFSVEDQRYRLSRYLDRDGTHSAKLNTVEDPEDPVARGVKAVEDKLLVILGFAYEEFVESFYLAQREITTPHPHSHAVKLMAGVAPLETVGEALSSEIEERREMIGEIEAEWEAVDNDVKSLAIQEGHLPHLEDDRHAMAGQLEQVNGVIEKMTDGLQTCTDNTAQVYQLQGAKGRAGLLKFLALILALFAGGLWALLTYGTDLPQADLARQLLLEHVPNWHDSKVQLLGYIGVGFAVLFFLIWLHGAGLRRKIASLRAETLVLAEAMTEAREIDVEPIMPQEVDFEEDAAPIALDVPDRPEHGEFEMLRKLLEQGEATTRLAGEYCERETAWLTHVSDQLGEQVVELDQEIDDEQSRLQEAINLSDVLTGLTEKRQEIEAWIADRTRGLELLDGAIAHLSSHFNRDIKELVGRMLPLFTDGRYEHLQIDQDLKVRVFSNDKRDFMDLEEVSSGTQRQIMLALRLALSKKLLGRTVKGKQFAFLDEPFAFFDQGRTRTALQALADLGDDISQVWIVAQDFPENCKVDFDTIINCERESNTLSAST
jgi:exonuclease SbcC